MESNDIEDQVRNTQSDVEPIDIEYLLEDNQRVVNFLTAGTQEDKQRFIDLLRAKLDREWEARKAVSQARVCHTCLGIKFVFYLVQMLLRDLHAGLNISGQCGNRSRMY
jgi:hypothetical protein